MPRTATRCILPLFALVLFAQVSFADDPILRVGIIGCDTPHATSFAKLINQAVAGSELSALKVVAAYPGGSPDIPASRNRIDGYVAELRRMDVQMVDSVDALLPLVDAVLLESLDGRPHLKQARPVLAARKPVFIDKPFAGSLADVVEILRLADQYKTPCFSSSALRYQEGVRRVVDKAPIGRVLGCDAFSSCELEPHHPDLFYYGIHGVETLFTIMGSGCVSVSRVHTDDGDLAVGVWKDGRIGTFRGLRGIEEYGATVFGERGITTAGTFTGYDLLVLEIARFFRTGKPPVSAAETLEIYTFMEAADESNRDGGKPVELADVLRKARESAKARQASR